MKYWPLLGLLFVGCSASLQTTTKKSTPYAPVNEVHGGTASYLDEGYKFVRVKRREDAYKKMHDYCQGPYKIVNEGVPADNDGTAVPIGGVLFYGGQRHVEIKFECVESTPPDPS